MAKVVVHYTGLSAEQKTRIGERILQVMHQEGAEEAALVAFVPASEDYYLTGGHFVEAPQVCAPAPTIVFEPAHPAPVSAPIPEAIPAPSDDFKTRARRTKTELEHLKQRLVDHLKKDGSLSSFDAQNCLGLKDCDWAPATLRRFFTELEEEELIVKQGQKRGTRYVWKDYVDGRTETGLPEPILSKPAEEATPEVSENPEA